MADWKVDRLKHLLTIDWKVGSLANLFDVDSKFDRSLNPVELLVNGLNSLEKIFNKIFDVFVTSNELDLFNRAVRNHRDKILYLPLRRYGKASLSLLQDLNLCNLDKGLRVKHVEFSHNCLMLIILNQMLNCDQFAVTKTCTDFTINANCSVVETMTNIWLWREVVYVNLEVTFTDSKWLCKLVVERGSLFQIGSNIY